MSTAIISASILSADFANLGQDCQAMLMAGADMIHFDVMDHHFVPNLSFGAVVCAALRKAGITAPIDVHLMVDDPMPYLAPFANAGANFITFHPETVRDIEHTVATIESHGLGAGVAFNPPQMITLDDTLLQRLALVLIMSVNPGFGGQAFMPDVLPKVRQLRQRLKRLNANTWLAIDGGIKLDNIQAVTEAGADFLVMGSGLFGADDYSTRVAAVRQQMEDF